NPNLPPDSGDYLTPAGVHATYSGAGLTIVLNNIVHHPFAASAIRTPIGGDEREQFNSSLTGRISVNGSPDQPTSGAGPCDTLVFGKVGHITGTFNTEMLSLDLSGTSPFGPYMVRESPTLPSLGQTTITDIGGGMYHIDSFFDVFTELSIDGGGSRVPPARPPHAQLNPSPPPPSLPGIAGLVGARSRRK